LAGADSRAGHIGAFTPNRTRAEAQLHFYTLPFKSRFSLSLVSDYESEKLHHTRATLLSKS
jgi:hypothetical protein